MSERSPGSAATAGPDQCRELLRAGGARCTGPRVQVLQALAGHAGHLSAGEIHRRLAERGGTLNISTVYRTVERLIGLGLVHAVSGRGGEGSYGLVGEPHHHAVCTACGAVDEIPADRLAEVVAAAAGATAFQLDSLMLSGLCPDCDRL